MPLAPSLVEASGVSTWSQHDVGHLVGHRHEVVGHRSVQQVGVVAVDALLEQHRADALHDAAAHLLVHQERVDDPAAVVDRPLAEQLDEAGLAVDLDVARLHAVGHVVHLVVGDEARAHRKLHVEVARQRVLPEISDAADVGEADHGLAGARVDHLAVGDGERVRRRLRDGAGEREDVLLEHRAGAQRGLAADRGAARGPGAAAIGRDRAVAAGHADLLDRHADAVGDDLRDARQRALALVGQARDAAHRAGRLEPQRAAVLGRDRRAGGAVVGRPIGGLLAEGRDADAAVICLACAARACSLRSAS